MVRVGPPYAFPTKATGPHPSLGGVAVGWVVGGGVEAVVGVGDDAGGGGLGELPEAEAEEPLRVRDHWGGGSGGKEGEGVRSMRGDRERRCGRGGGA